MANFLTQAQTLYMISFLKLVYTVVSMLLMQSQTFLQLLHSKKFHMFFTVQELED